MNIRLTDAANVIRSKNAGPFELTLDILVKDPALYRKMKDANIISKKTVAELYRIPETSVLNIVYFDNALAIKATLVRPMPSGAMGERDVYGAQQHAPLMGFTFDI